MDSRETYGSPRVCVQLNMKGLACSEGYIAKLMREAGIRAKASRRFRVTTDSEHKLKVADNLLERNFLPDQPGKAWAGDITYIRTLEGWLYLAIVMDLNSRMVVGWAVSTRLKTELVRDALTMALQRRKPQSGCLFHSDQGVQFAKLYHSGILRAYELTSSMSRKGNCWDNAVVESFFKTLKCELFDGIIPKSRIEAANMLMRYIEIFYNRQRLHSTLGYKSPAEFERLNALN